LRHSFALSRKDPSYIESGGLENTKKPDVTEHRANEGNEKSKLFTE
jgi:hypothetical protein